MGHHHDGIITNSYSTGAVMGNEEVGGLVGGFSCMGPGVVVSNCYSTGPVIGQASVGGLVGIIGLCIEMGCFWDMEISGQNASSGGTGLTTAEMQTASTFLEAGWDFIDETANGTEDIWWIPEGQDYPRLWWERPADDVMALVVDDFESYTGDDTDEKPVIWHFWIGTMLLPVNGVMVGHMLPPYAEQTIVHGGSLSMPLYYNNTNGVVTSRARRAFSEQDWTTNGADTLSLWFRGAADNGIDVFFITVNEVTLLHPDPEAVVADTWTQWLIPLSDLTAAGVNIQRIDSMWIGVGDMTRPSQNASGILYIDDITVIKCISWRRSGY